MIRFSTFFNFYFRITVTGIYRATPVRMNPRQRNVKSVYRVHIDVIHFRKSDKKRLHESDPDSGVRFTQERIDKLTEISKMPDIYERLSKALGKTFAGSKWRTIFQ